MIVLLEWQYNGKGERNSTRKLASQLSSRLIHLFMSKGIEYAFTGPFIASPLIRSSRYGRENVDDRIGRKAERIPSFATARCKTNSE